MPRPATGKSPSVFASLRLPPSTAQLWEDTAKAMGLSKTATFTVAIRALARREGIVERTDEEQAA